MNIAVCGAGAFSLFSVQAFLKVSGVKCTAVYDTSREKADAFAETFKCRIYNSFESLLDDATTHLVYIATPPFLHFEQSKAALQAGKHVICEKPAALVPEQAEELIGIAEKNHLLYVVNLMQRYNPLYRIIETIIQEKLLGKFLHGFFENYASGESVHTGHWMWDESKSGGIFIEHAVHFYDMFEGWFGKGFPVTSQKVWYPGNKKEAWTQVQSIVDYDGCPVNFYHGFNQPGILDRQEIRLLFEKGDISLYEWIPVLTRLHGLVNETELKKLEQLFPDAEIKKVNGFKGEDRRCRGHYRDYDISCEIILEDGKAEDKLIRYQQMITYMLEDQIKWIKNRDHQPVITGLNGLNSLKMAFASEQLAIEL